MTIKPPLTILPNSALDLELEINKGTIKVEECVLNKTKAAENEISSLKKQIKKLKANIQNFNSRITETRNRLTREKIESEKALKEDIKVWKKELGNERKLKIKFEKKLNKISVLSRISATPSRPVSNFS